jgi:dipeptidyl aminopeptidase/acylaminoacyl peptidase
VAIGGGSYGGYMTAWLASQTNRYRCGIAHACVFDIAGCYGGDVTQDLGTEMGGEPWGDAAERAALRKNDPASFTQGYATPLLVIHGEKDYRCPDHNGLYLYGVLKARGVPARLVHYADENHWICKPQSSLHWYGEVLAWLARYLKP